MTEYTTHAQNIRKLITEKNYEGLETYLQQKPPQQAWSSTLGWCRDINNLNDAVRARDLRAVALLIKYQADVVEYWNLTPEDRLFLGPFYEDDETALCRMHIVLLISTGVQSGDIREIKYWHEDRKGLFSLILSPENFNKYGNPMIICCRKGFTDCVEYLITQIPTVYPTINDPIFYHQYQTPLTAALQGGHTKTADLLLSHGANVHMEVEFLVSAPRRETTKLPIVHHLCLMAAYEYAKSTTEIETSLKWIFEHGVDFDKNFPILDDYDNTSLHVPALVLACRLLQPSVAALLIEFHKDKWKNNAGPLLESLAVAAKTDHKNDSAGQEQILRLIDILMPYANPDTKEENLANSLAAAIRYKNEFYENYLSVTLGADLTKMTKKVKYHHRTGSNVASRMKLSFNGASVLNEENEDKEYVVDRVDITSKAAQTSRIKEKMKNISDASDIYFELTGLTTDPKFHLWRGVKHAQLPHNFSFPREFKLYDKETGIIYTGNKEVSDLVFGEKGQPYLSTRSFASEPAFTERFALFIRNNDTSLMLPKGYRIMFKPVEFLKEKFLEPARTIAVSKNNNDKNSEDDEENDEEKDIQPRRSARTASKRKQEAVDEAHDDQPPAKRRKTKK